jgi:exopolyphosphatase/guanosine-5'-triphosphate,3'-diphosphate pyrophosphatase
MSSFPIRVASIDVGSNALRFLATEFTNRTNFNVLSFDRYPLRLGHDVFLEGRMKDKTINSAIRCMRTFYSYLKDLNIEKYRAIATSALRESRNGDVLIMRLRERVGIHLERISESEESRLIYQSIKKRFPFENAKWVLVDVGGGSVEVLLATERDILWSTSYATGAIKLLNMFTKAKEDPGDLKGLIENYLQTLSIPPLIKEKKPAGLIATGGNIEAIAAIIHPSDTGSTNRITITQLKDLTEKLSRYSCQERIREFDLEKNRADVIIPASLVYQRLAVLTGTEEIIVPHARLTEGIVLDLVNSLQNCNDRPDAGNLTTNITSPQQP